MEKGQIEDRNIVVQGPRNPAALRPSAHGGHELEGDKGRILYESDRKRFKKRGRKESQRKGALTQTHKGRAAKDAVVGATPNPAGEGTLPLRGVQEKRSGERPRPPL